MIEYTLVAIMKNHNVNTTNDFTITHLLIEAMGMLKSNLIHFPKILNAEGIIDEIVYKRQIVHSCASD